MFLHSGALNFETYLPAPAQWRRVAKAAAAVVSLTRRDTGLWTLPTTERELNLTFSPASSVEHKIRSSEAFGSETISLTWTALSALKSLLGRVPEPVLASVFRELAGSHIGGAYGSRLPGMQAGLRINRSARHSAMALLVHLDFSDEVNPKSRLNLLRPTVAWIVEQRSKDGGWPFEEAYPEVAQPFTTAVCLAALACFLSDVRGRGPSIDQKLRDDVTARVREGFEALLALKKGHLWEGIYKHTEVADSAFIIDILWMAFARGDLRLAVPDVERDLRLLQDHLVALQKGLGWPETFDGGKPSLAPTIAALLALANRSGESATFARRTREVDKFVLNQLFLHDSAGTLKAWDWPMLARLASNHFGQLSDSEAYRLVRTCDEMKKLAGRGQLTRLHASAISRIGRLPALFALTRGHPLSVPLGFLQALPVPVRWTVVLLGGTSAAIFHEKVAVFIKKVGAELLRALGLH